MNTPDPRRNSKTRTRWWGRGGIAAAAIACLVLLTGAPANAIIGGGNVSSAQPYPWIASVQQADGSNFCTGVLIAPTWVLTAGHCAGNGITKVRIGSTDKDSGGRLVAVNGVRVHPGFSNLTQPGYDLALFHLASRVTTPTIPAASGTSFAGQDIRILGWGDTTGHDQYPRFLKGATNRIVQNACPGDTGQTFSASLEWCMVPVDGRACHADSGGPALVYQNGLWRLMGTVSRGTDFCPDSDLTIFENTLVPAHRDWINSVISQP